MKIYKFCILQFVLAAMLFSCMGSENEVTPDIKDDNFAEFSMELLESLHNTYDPNDLELSVTKDINGNEKAIFRLKNRVKSALVKSNSLNSNNKTSIVTMSYSEDGGTECNKKNKLRKSYC